MSTIEFFELCYLEEIDSVFKELQEICKAYNLDLLHKLNKDNSSILFDFIFQNVQVRDNDTEINILNESDDPDEDYA